MVRVTARRVCLFGLVLLFTIPPPAFRSGWVAGWNTKSETLRQKFGALPVGGAVRHTVGS